MAGYKVIIRKDQKGDGCPLPSWRHGCPILVDAIQVSRNTESGRAFVQSRVRNISDKPIGSLLLKAIVTQSNGEVVEYEHRNLDADIAPGATYDIKPIELSDGDVSDVDLTVVTAGDDWTEGSQSSEAVKREPIAIDEQRLQERVLVMQEAGCSHADSASQYRVSDFETWWLCPCGGVNVGRDACWSCGGDKEKMLASEDPELLAQHEHDRKEAEAARELAEKEAAEVAKVKRKRAATIAACITAVTLVASLVITQIIIPANKYKQAVGLEESGEFDGAFELYSELGNYRDSKARADVCEEGAVADLIKVGNYTAAMKRASTMQSENGSRLYAQAEIGIIKKASIGSLVKFGHNDDGSEREWVVLDKKDDDALLLSKYLYGTYKMNPSGEGDNWADSWLRKELNSEEYLNAIASKDEQEYIVKTQHAYDGDPVFSNGTYEYRDGTMKSCKDMVFMLNTVDALNHYSTNESRRKYVYGTDNKTIGTWLLTDFDYYESTKQTLPKCVDCDNGIILYCNNDMDAYVCPAMWVYIP